MDEARTLLSTTLEPDQLEATMRVLDDTIDRCGSRLRRLARWYEEQNVAIFVNDQTEYDFFRSIFQNERALIIRGDLTASASMQGIGRVAAEHNMPIRVVYLSNTEQYFEYGGGFDANMEAMNFDDTSWVIHTRHFSGWPRVEGDDYHYLMQPGPNLVAWLRDDVGDFFRMVRHARSHQETGLSILDRTPEED